MNTPGIVCAGLFALAVTGCGSTSTTTSQTTPAGVLVVDDASRVSGCRALGTVADNELGDLQKKAAKLGGNVALMTPQRTSKGGYFGLQEYMTADVYRCEAMLTR